MLLGVAFLAAVVYLDIGVVGVLLGEYKAEAEWRVETKISSIMDVRLFVGGRRLSVARSHLMTDRQK